MMTKTEIVHATILLVKHLAPLWQCGSIPNLSIFSIFSVCVLSEYNYNFFLEASSTVCVKFSYHSFIFIGIISPCNF